MSIRINNVRLAFPNLFEAKQVNNQGTPKYSGSFILDKNHPQMKDISTEILAAATKKWDAKAADVLRTLKASDKIALHDGDGKMNKNGEAVQGYAGQWYINASNTDKPPLYDQARNLVGSESGLFYSGCFVTVIVDFWAQDNQFGRRLNASLMGVQFAKHGERLSGGGVASADQFEALAAAEGGKEDASALFDYSSSRKP